MVKIRDKIDYINIEDIKEYKNNNKNHNEKQINLLVENIKRFGFTTPLLLDKKNKTLVAGHGRLEAGKRLDLKKLPFIDVSDLSKTEQKILRIADNKLTELGEWNIDNLRLELTELNSLDELDLTGFELSDLNVFGSKEENEVEEDDFDVPEIEEIKTDIKKGDIIQLGNHRLMCGDATKEEDVKTLVGTNKINLYITDPPYNVNYEGGTKDKLKIMNDNMSNSNFRKFLVDSFKTADSVMKEGACFYIWHSDSEGYNFRGACFDIDWDIKECLIWVKNQLIFGRQDYHWKHEPCLYGWKKGAAHFWNSDRTQTTVLEFNRPIRNAEHPTMKPVELFGYLIKNSSNKTHCVLDTFAGSGTTVIACEELNRKSFVMELEPKYCEVIC